MKKSQKITFSVSRFSAVVACDRHELARKLALSGVKPDGGDGRGMEYGLRDLINAHMGGDIRREQLRKTTEEADRLALANARSRGELVEIASVKKLGEKVMIAVRNRILNMPLTDEEKDRCLIELLDLGKLDWSREA